MAETSKKSKEKVEYTKPTSQLDLEERLGKDHEVPVFNASVNPEESPLLDSDEDYVGTDLIYQNHANDFDAPKAAEDGPDKLAEEAFFDSYGDGSKEPSDLVKENYEAVTAATRPADSNEKK